MLLFRATHHSDTVKLDIVLSYINSECCLLSGFDSISVIDLDVANHKARANMHKCTQNRISEHEHTHAHIYEVYIHSTRTCVPIRVQLYDQNIIEL